MFVEDYRELAAPGWERIARRCILFERFIDDLLAAEPAALRFRPRSGRMLIHPHCHVKSLMNPAFLRRLALRLPGREVNLLDSSCCGMAGAFGALREKYELSLLLAEPLVQTVRGVLYGTTVVASGTSCRQQLTHLGPIRPRHMAEVLAAALETNDD
jgi:Fe-S oxidoreductase